MGPPSGFAPQTVWMCPPTPTRHTAQAPQGHGPRSWVPPEADFLTFPPRRRVPFGLRGLSEVFTQPREAEWRLAEPPACPCGHQPSSLTSPPTFLVVPGL